MIILFNLFHMNKKNYLLRKIYRVQIHMILLSLYFFHIERYLPSDRYNFLAVWNNKELWKLWKKEERVVLLRKIVINFIYFVYFQLYTCHSTLVSTTGTLVNDMGKSSRNIDFLKILSEKVLYTWPHIKNMIPHHCMPNIKLGKNTTCQ